MKNFNENNYYELLELPTDASIEQVHLAYEHAKKTFSEDSLAAHSLFSHDEKQQQIEKIEQAYRVLMNAPARREYDMGLGLLKEPPASDKVKGTPSGPSQGVAPGPVNGALLKQLREEMGMSLEDMAARTRILYVHLRLIEEDQHDKLPADVYLRSYLSDYAQMLGLNPKQVVDDYLQARATGQLRR